MNLATVRRYFIIGRHGHDYREPLPAGHPVTWGAITVGTELAGSDYPLPVLTNRRDDETHRAMILLGLAPAPVSLVGL